MANPFERFLEFRKLGLWQKKTSQVVGIDIGASSVKLVQLRKDKGRAILETYGEIATGPYRDNALAVGQAAVLPNDKMVELLRDLFREANVTTANASFSLPLGSSLLMIIEVPKVSEEMLAKVVPIEARKYIPVPISEVAIDWWAIPPIPLEGQTEEEADKTPTVEVLVVAIHNTVINQYHELSKLTEVEPAFFEIETFSAIRSIFSGETSPTIILDLGASATKVAIVDYGIVRLSHIIGKGAQDITLAVSRALGVDFSKAEEIKRKVGLVERLDDERNVASTISGLVEYIFAEVNKVISTYQQKRRRSIGKVIIIGGGALTGGLLDLAAKSFEAPVVMGHPFVKVESPAFLEEILREAGPEFASAIGLALRHLQTLD